MAPPPDKLGGQPQKTVESTLGTRFSRLGPPTCRTVNAAGASLCLLLTAQHRIPGTGRGTAPHPPGILPGGRAGRGMANGSGADPRVGALMRVLHVGACRTEATSHSSRLRASVQGSALKAGRATWNPTSEPRVAVDRDHVRSSLACLATELDDRVVREVTDVVRQPVLAAQALAMALVVRQVVPPCRRIAAPRV